MHTPEGRSISSVGMAVGPKIPVVGNQGVGS